MQLKSTPYTCREHGIFEKMSEAEVIDAVISICSTGPRWKPDNIHTSTRGRKASLHTVYKALSKDDVDRIIIYCKDNTIPKGGVFEVYPRSDGMMTMIVVNSPPEDEPLDKFRPLGAFYCHYLGPGIISLDEADPHHEGMPSAKLHIKAIKKVIDDLTTRLEDN